MKSVIRSIKNEINNYDEGERLVRELTSNEQAPPTKPELIKLKHMLGDQYQFPTIVRMLFKRLKDYNNIRHVEKSLIVVEYLIKEADQKFVRYCQRDKRSIAKLQRYRYILGNNNGVPVDYGGNIRKRAKRIVDLLDKEEKLRASRAKAQGYAMPNKSKSASSASQTKRTTNNKSSSSSASKPKKKKKAKKKKEENTVSASPQPQEPQYESFIDVPADNQNASNSSLQGQGGGGNDDLLSGDWWKGDDQQADPFNNHDEDEFGWFQSGDAVNEQQTGVGDDGGQFGFGNDDDFTEEQKEAVDLNADSWMTSLTKMENVLDGAIQKKDVNKRNVKGRSMAQMVKTTPSTQAMPDAFGSGADDFFNQNSGNSGNNANDFDPFGLGNSNNNNAAATNNITALYAQSNNNKKSAFGGGYTANNTGFGYQGQAAMNAYSNDPFAGIGAAAGPQPAKYVPRQKQQDPFAQFGSMK
mmetsp:Transcript_55874/g.88917  ORF Transcript_55874/g.88917 Transcript_55874/m.88917 type:complete len:469 (+) Transcript_55874:57-1463(+)|eukprot:CAMPEP_0197022484 /NCGR_PEP_ID=MMETSP1384-20130603/3348_1 /TAXON_ID=29189 /ORGANISM="Ammonia sp." /LENGTH=468 /DNA_ID=CAMNT_0042450539 /DNA_START=30 /DNA_END=1436 /DNA_ORIENTATION=-